MNSQKSSSVMFTCLFLLSASVVKGAPNSNETDRASLLEFKSRVADDPERVFGSWNDTVNFCSWTGVMCGHRHSRVIRLELPRSSLGGYLSPYIGNLSFLRVLDIDNNSFTGEIPPQIGKLRRLVYLGFQNNSFSGQIPENISGCVNLRAIRLANSMLVGEIPRGLATLSELRTFFISGNNLTGKFPEFFGNFSFLEDIGGGSNKFSGTVPASLGRLQKLKSLYFGMNSFSGVFPSSIFNITSLEGIQFLQNQLEGSLSWDLGNTLPNLVYFNFAENHLTGPIPPSIGNATKLVILTIPTNNFSGSVPDLKNLNQLQWLNIGRNNLGGRAQSDLGFIESFNSTELQILVIAGNNFRGVLPQSIGNLSSQLSRFWLGINQLTGTIPPSIGNLQNLEVLAFGSNRFTGSIPVEVGLLHKLKFLVGPTNRFTGKIPSSVGNLTMLIIVDLSGNNFQGNIPTSLGNCQNLISMNLSQNNLSGTIPLQVLSISSLSSYLDLSLNKLTGALPEEIGRLKNLAKLYVQENRLSGQVPNTLSGCTSLEVLDMGSNLFEGKISTFLTPLQGLQYLDMSRNNFFGEIPKFLENFHLTYLNLSYSRFEGEVPNQGVFLNASAVSVMGNGKLCGGISALNLPSCPAPKLKSRKKISSKIIITTASGIVVLFIVFLLVAVDNRMKTNRRRNITSHLDLVPVGPFPQISYEDIYRATEGFNQNNMIGDGSFGSVYKGILENGGKMVAIKVLKLQNRSASKSFMAECEALRNIRHRNLVKIFTACSTIDFQGNDFKALVYEYMENGSLEEWMHPKVVVVGLRQRLSLFHRLSIAIDIACAVEYLHHEIDTPIIHCDLKPNNILLDAEMTAHVGDFGLARIISGTNMVLQTSSIGVRGTIGYSPQSMPWEGKCRGRATFTATASSCWRCSQVRDPPMTCLKMLGTLEATVRLP